MKLYFEASRTVRQWTPTEKQFVLDTLNNAQSWPVGTWSESKIRSRADWTIALESQDLINSYPGMKGLSVTFMAETPRKTYFSYENWTNLPSTLRGQYTLKEYRQYLVNHEAGHALGLSHPKRKQGTYAVLAPVMMQQTLGLSGFGPNVWPTPEERSLIFNV